MAHTWFKHDDDAAIDEKLIDLRMKHGPAGYGVWWLAVEYMHKHNGEIESVAKFSFTYNIDLGLAQAVLGHLLGCGLIAAQKDGEGFYSNRVKSQIAERTQRHEERSTSGKAGRLKQLAQAKVQAQPELSPGSERADKTRQDKTRTDNTSGDSLRSTIEKHLAREGSGVDNPKAYMAKLLESVKNDLPAVKKAWGDWQRGNGISSAGDFWARAKHYHVKAVASS